MNPENQLNRPELQFAPIEANEANEANSERGKLTAALFEAASGAAQGKGNPESGQAAYQALS